VAIESALDQKQSKNVNRTSFQTSIKTESVSFVFTRTRGRIHTIKIENKEDLRNVELNVIKTAETKRTTAGISAIAAKDIQIIH
jgi:hypothetical protein